MLFGEIEQLFVEKPLLHQVMAGYGRVEALKPRYEEKGWEKGA